MVKEYDLENSSAKCGGESGSESKSKKEKQVCEEEAEELEVAQDLERWKRQRMDQPPSPPHSPSTTTSGDGGESDVSAATTVMPSSSSIPVVNEDDFPPPPSFGVISVAGRSREMEDAVSVHPFLCRPVLTERRGLHFFAVFDGHGGPQVATLCEERMHVFLREELMRECGHVEEGEEVEDELKKKWKAVLERSFARMDEVALSACACGYIGNNQQPCGCERAGLPNIVGSTAVVALITPHHILLANCGDSRAVLSRAGRAIPLSHDHKPDRPDELARIEASGGRVIYLNGARVHGILAMSRAMGDRYLKPSVISEPEISFTARSPTQDECLILASDGLWDVISNGLACDVARRCLNEANSSRVLEALDNVTQTQATEGNLSEQMHQAHCKCSLAAALLTRLALGRKSGDNISVIVIDLKNMVR